MPLSMAFAITAALIIGAAFLLHLFSWKGIAAWLVLNALVFCALLLGSMQ